MTSGPHFDKYSKLKKIKGSIGGECVVNCCRNSDAYYRSHLNGFFYCEECAALVNEVNPKYQRERGHPICEYIPLRVI